MSLVRINNLQIRQSKIDLEVEILVIESVREFSKFGQIGKVATAIVKDDSGQIKLTIWNEDIDKVKVGDKVKITNGYVTEFQGEPQLTPGRFGKLEVIKK